MKKSRTTPSEDFKPGQIWKMKGSQLEIGIVGRHLVHYKLFKGEMKRTSNSMSNKDQVKEFLKKNKAILVQE